MHTTKKNGQMATFDRTAREDGWYVTFGGMHTIFYADSGGSWQYDREEGLLGAQREGRHDVQAPKDPAAMRRFVRDRMH